MTRHPFEPARLLLGLVMVAVAVAYLLDASGEWDVPHWVLPIVVPAALLLAGCTALATLWARRSLASRRRGLPGGSGGEGREGRPGEPVDRR
ncbi:hypothetical protein [Streptomyces cacaoi]|uniref:Uncharacterized protein n=1 Tax=Streptomyces cacaoi TaxID=1898 RepID=A0A4Y3QUC4_STRCI|nr:hypothetical protein [Streptomyces cacaoi]NNG86558.1 hypothetical protein [Streptomyces cacaoi]GEB48841.1 hypothetical protein SCA03_13920 [Streptomyces cacaoi]